MTVRYTYLGDGSSNPSNVPAQDITDEDWDAFTDEQKQAVTDHPHLYEEHHEASTTKHKG